MSDGLGRAGSLFVLGGGSDIALAAADALVGRGARRVVLAARRPAAIEAAGARLRARGAAVEVRAFDAEALETHAMLVDEVFEGGDVDVALVAFGILGDQAAAEKDPSLAAHIMTTNHVGAVSVLTSLANRMDEQGHGTIVVLSSVAAERGRRSNYVYGSSKAGLDIFAQGLGDRLRGRGVRVLIVRPGFVVSKMTRGLRPAPLATTPEAVASAIVAGLTSRADIVWAPSSLRWVMSALRHLPRAIFRKLPI